MRAVTILLAAPVIGLSLAASPASAAPAAASPYHAALAASEEVPTPGPAGGTGTAQVTIDQVTNQVCYTLTWSPQVGTPTAAHLHLGPKGTAGPIVVKFNVPAQPSGCVAPEAGTSLANIAQNPGNYYVNVHSAAYPNGAIRGQLQAG
jgi:hypothetical protein